MSELVIPTIGSSGYYELRPPFDSLIVANERYTCQAVRRISEYLSTNEDPKTDIYLKNGLTDSDYEEDAKVNMSIVSLQSAKGHWLYVPAKYIITYPITNGIPYRAVMIGVSLPSMPVTKDLSHIQKDISNIIQDGLGVKPAIKLVETSRVVLIDKAKHDLTEANRAMLAKGKITDRSRYTSLLVNHQHALNKVQMLEDYIRTKHTGEVIEVPDITKVPVIVKPVIISPTNNNPNTNLDTVNCFSSEFVVTNDSRDIHLASHWQVSTDILFNNLIINSAEDIINKTTFTITGLSPNNTYYIRVRYYGEQLKYGEWSDVVMFQTANVFPGYISKPNILFPLNNSANHFDTVICKSSPIIINNIQDKHTGSNWQVASDNEFTNIISDITVNPSSEEETFTLSNLTNDSEYFIRLRYRTEVIGWSSWSAIVKIKTVEIFPDVIYTPNIISPTHNSIDVINSITFISSEFKTNNARLVHNGTDWQLSDSPLFNNIIRNEINSDTELVTWNVSDLEPNKTYYARVRYLSNNIISNWSSIVAFKTMEVYPMLIKRPILIYPSNNSIDIDGTLMCVSSDFTVSEGQDIHIASDWQLATDNKFTNIVQESILSETNKTTWTIDNLSTDTVYYLRVRYKGQTLGYSKWSDISSIKTKTSFVSIVKPNILAPLNNTTDIGSVLEIFAGEFTVNEGSDIHISTDWQIATDTSFNNILIDIKDITDEHITNTIFANKTKLVVSSLDKSTKYYIRLRYKGQSLGYSKWSDILEITTRESFIFYKETALISPNINSSEYAYKSSISDNGKTLVILSMGVNYILSIYKNQNNSWENVFVKTFTNINEIGAAIIKISGDGRTVLMTSPNAFVNTYNTAGTFLVIRDIENTWTELQTPTNIPGITSGLTLGMSADLTYDGNSLVLGSNAHNGNGYFWAGAVYNFEIENNQIIFKHLVFADDYIQHGCFGYNVAINSSGTHMVITSNLFYSVNSERLRDIYVFRKTETGWSQYQKIRPELGVQVAGFGEDIHISDDATTILTGAHLLNKGRGEAYVYRLGPNIYSLSNIIKANVQDIHFGKILALSKDGKTACICSYDRDNLPDKIATYAIDNTDAILINRFEYSTGDNNKINDISIDSSAITGCVAVNATGCFIFK